MQFTCGLDDLQPYLLLELNQLHCHLHSMTPRILICVTLPPPPPPVPHHETKIKNLRWTWKLNCSSPLRTKKPNKNALRPQESFFSSQWPFRVRQPHPGGTAATPRHEADQFSRPSMCRWDRSRVNFFSLLFLIFSLFDKEVHLFIYVTSRI